MPVLRTCITFQLQEHFSRRLSCGVDIRRARFEQQLRLGVTPIEKIIIGDGRDRQIAVLYGLQWIFTTPEVNQEIFALLESKLTDKQKSLGRKGMDLWTILVANAARIHVG